MQKGDEVRKDDKERNSNINDLYQDGFIVMTKTRERYLEEKTNQEYKKLKTVLIKGHHNCKALLIVSSMPREGCTGVAVNLAKELAGENGEMVIIIDANLKNPALFRWLNIDQKNGLLDILKDTTFAKARKMVQSASSSDIRNTDAFMREAEKAFEEIVEPFIKKTGVRNLMAISSGIVAGNGLLSVENENLRYLIRFLRKKFDHILIDGAPANLYHDSLLIAPHVDGIILVVEAEKTRREIIMKVKEEFENIDGKVIGVVLNKQRYYIPESIYKLI